MTNDLYIGVVYIVPPNSSSLNAKPDAFDILEKEISYYASLGDIILGGDFNSRLGYRFKDYIFLQTQMNFCQLTRCMIKIFTGEGQGWWMGRG